MFVRMASFVPENDYRYAEACDHNILEYSLLEENDILEVIDLEKDSGFYTTSIDMTSLASFIYTDRDKRPIYMTSNGSVVNQEANDDTRLTLAYERLHTIPKTIIDKFGPTLQILDISHNRVRTLDFLAHFKNLTALIADNNHICESTVLPPMPKLEILWFNHNKVERLYPWIKKLQNSCPNLKHLSLMGNAAAPSYFNGGSFYEYLQYRLYVISLFPSLLHLDDRPVSEDQRQEAVRLYRRPLIERIYTFANKDANLPSSTFIKLYSNLSQMFERNKNVKRRQNLLI